MFSGFFHDFWLSSRNYKLKLWWGRALNFRKHFFVITVDPMVLPGGPPFCSGLEIQDLSAPVWRPCPFSRQKHNFFKKASKSWSLITKSKIRLLCYQSAYCTLHFWSTLKLLHEVIVNVFIYWDNSDVFDIFWDRKLKCFRWNSRIVLPLGQALLDLCLSEKEMSFVIDKIASSLCLLKLVEVPQMIHSLLVAASKVICSACIWEQLLRKI